MKKILLATILIISGTFMTSAFLNMNLQAEAKEKSMSSKLAKNLKKGTFPDAYGKIGLLKKNLKSHNGLLVTPFIKDTIGDDYYVFNSSNPTPNSKIILIERSYTYLISSSSIKKKLGKELKYYSLSNSVQENRTSFYNAGKYYVGIYKFSSISDTYTILQVGTKKAIMNSYDVIFY